jgi:exopolysaccharide biosynthesis polyprenyl glycosylphosphotransferase
VTDPGQSGANTRRHPLKRAFDIIVAALLLALLSPLMLLTIVLIKIESRGSVIFRQRRVGENGRPFTMLKFRSMQASADPNVHKSYVTSLIERNIGPEPGGSGAGSLKMKDDPRITRVGRVIRKTSIDELPQLVNVLRGEMSLVGPRPPLPYEVELYKEWHKRRLEAPPGVTGWWQVKGRNRVAFDEMVRMDIYYIDNASFWFDLRILLLTPWAAISGRGAD